MDEIYIQRCIELSVLAKEHGKYPVGSLIVRDNTILVEAYEGEDNYPSTIAHAETVVILKAIELLHTTDLSDCILYSTKEPCFMCSYLIRQTGIKGVIFSTSAGDIGGATSNYPFLKSDAIRNWKNVPFLKEGILKEQAEKVIEEYYQEKSKN